MSFDEQGRKDRREAASEGRSVSTSHAIAGGDYTLPVLVGASSAGLFAFGAILFVTFAPVVGAFAMAGGVGFAGLSVLAFRRAGSKGSGAPSRQDQFGAAFETARDAIENARSLDEPRKLEIVAALSAALDQVRRSESERDGLMSALNNLPDRDSDAGRRLGAALDKLDASRDSFLEQCARLQGTVATLAIGSDRGQALAELTEVTATLGLEAAADREVADALERGARRKQTEGG